MIGVIDVGSNSVRLLVAEWDGVEYREIARDIRTTRLIEGMKDGIPTREASERTLAAMRDFTRKARMCGCETVAGFATSAMRDAKNRDELMARAAEFGLPVELIAGEDEARLAYMGVQENGLTGVIDIGGGSTELVTGENGCVLSCACVPVGAIRLQNELNGAMPAALVARAKQILLPAWEQVADSGAQNWVGISGTMKCIKALEIGALDWKRIAGQTLTREYTEQTLHRLCALPLEEKRAIPGMNQDRADVLHFGAAILTAFFELSRLSHITVTDGGDNMLGYARLRNLR